MSTRLELLKRYLEEDPADSFLRYAIAIEYIGVSDHKLALEHLKTLINVDPDYLASYYMAGQCCEVLGRPGDASMYYEKGIVVAEHQKEMHTLMELKNALLMVNG
jgi:tetratricopeptide (TPR) repeat protein